MTATDRYRGCLLGLACGDAVGTTVEFKRPGSFAPVTDMVIERCRGDVEGPGDVRHPRFATCVAGRPDDLLAGDARRTATSLRAAVHVARSPR